MPKHIAKSCFHQRRRPINNFTDSMLNQRHQSLEFLSSKLARLKTRETMKSCEIGSDRDERQEIVWTKNKIFI